MKKWVQNGALFFLAIFLVAIVFIFDYNVPSNIAAGAIYSIVILYSWLLPGNWTTTIVAILSTLLILFCAIYTTDPIETSRLNGINTVISIVVVWITVILVAIARKGIQSMEGIKNGLERLVNKRTAKLKANEVKLIQYNKKLTATNAELEQFAYIASHDLQEPLRTVTSFTNLIAKNYSSHFDDAGKKSLAFINEATNRMSNLIKGLLDFSRIGREPKLTVVDCNKLVESIKTDLGTIIKETKTNLIIGKLPEIKGYKTELRLLFQNLISNAIKFNNKKSTPIIKIDVKEKEDFWEFSIADNGIGIEEKNLEKIFLIFQRINNRTEYEGTGIGLAHCKKIVELHKGKIWVTSVFGEGSVFYFTLPK